MVFFSISSSMYKRTHPPPCPLPLVLPICVRKRPEKEIRISRIAISWRAWFWDT